MLAAAVECEICYRFLDQIRRDREGKIDCWRLGRMMGRVFRAHGAAALQGVCAQQGACDGRMTQLCMSITALPGSFPSF